MLRVQPHLIDAVGHLGEPRVGRRCKGFAVQIHLPQGPQRVDNEHIRIEVQHPLHLPGQDQRREQPVVHLLRVALAGGGAFKERRVHGDGPQRRAEGSAERRQLLQLLRRDGAVEQVHSDVRLRGVAGEKGIQHDLAGQQIVFIKRQQYIHHGLLRFCFQLTSLNIMQISGCPQGGKAIVHTLFREGSQDRWKVFSPSSPITQTQTAPA